MNPLKILFLAFIGIFLVVFIGLMLLGVLLLTFMLLFVSVPIVAIALFLLLLLFGGKWLVKALLFILALVLIVIGVLILVNLLL